jgi:superfamily II DNA/RNA helicase
MTDAFEVRDAQLCAPDIDVVDETASPVPAGEPSAFEALGLAPQLLQAVADLGFVQPTAVQQATIPRAMSGLSSQSTDLMVSSQTGSGKTAAFLLPVLHTLLLQQQAQAEREAAE